MEDVIKSKDRSQAGFSAPAHGLYLTHIEYPENIFNNDYSFWSNSYCSIDYVKSHKILEG